MKRFIAAAVLIVCLVILSVGIAYSAVPVEGHIEFVEGTTLTEAFSAVEPYGVTLLTFSMTTPYKGGISTTLIQSDERDTEVLRNRFWRNYARSVMEDHPDRIRRWSEHSAGKPRLIQQIAEMQAEIDRFPTGPESGCWDRGDCPDLTVGLMEFIAPVATIQSISVTAPIEAVYWEGMLGIVEAAVGNDDGFLENSARVDLPLDSWVPTKVDVAGGAVDDETRFLSTEVSWKDDDALRFLQSGPTAIRTSVSLKVEDGVYYDDTPTLGGLPAVIGGEIDKNPEYFEPRLWGIGNARDGTLDYVTGTRYAETMKSEVVYWTKIALANGLADVDEGDVGTEVGHRLCRWQSCDLFNHIVTYPHLAGLPGENDIFIFRYFVSLPIIDGASPANRQE